MVDKGGWSKDTWKKIAVVSIVLNILVLLAVKGLMDIGLEEIRREEDCGILCTNVDAEAYQFDSYTRVCYCLSDGELVYQQRIT